MKNVLTPKTAPYLVLGVPSYATIDECLTGFALRSRRIKNESSSAYSIEDLTLALSEVEHGKREESLTLRYAIPCDKNAFRPDSEFSHRGQKFTPTSDLSSLDTSAFDADTRERASAVFLAASIFQILEWNWNAAANYSRECLRLAKHENERDEALNILAASLALTGEVDRAIDALKKAVEGEWNLPLQMNLAILATEMDQSLAVAQMSHLISGASSSAERLQATRYAIQLWRLSQGEETGSDDEDDYEPLPKQLLDSIYELMSEPGIDEEEFFDLGMFLARVDASGLTESGAIDSGHFSNTPSAEAIRLRIAGFSEFVDGISAVAARSTKGERPWIDEQIESLVSSLNSQLIDVDEDGRIANLIAFGMLSNGLDASTFARVSLRFLLVRQLHKIIEIGTHPSDRFIDWMDEASQALDAGDIQMTDEQREILGSIRDAAGNVLGIVCHQALVNEGSDIERAANQIATRMRGFLSRMTTDRSAVHDVSDKIVRSCNEALSTYRRILPYVTLDDLRKDMEAVRRSYENIKSLVSRY